MYHRDDVHMMHYRQEIQNDQAHYKCSPNYKDCQVIEKVCVAVADNIAVGVV